MKVDDRHFFIMTWMKVAVLIAIIACSSAFLSINGGVKADSNSSPFSVTTDPTKLDPQEPLNSDQAIQFKFVFHSNGSQKYSGFNKDDKIVLKIQDTSGEVSFNKNDISFASSTTDPTIKDSIFDFAVKPDTDSGYTDIVLTPSSKYDDQFYESILKAGMSLAIKPSSSIGTDGPTEPITVQAELQSNDYGTHTILDTSFAVNNKSSNNGGGASTDKIGDQIFRNALGIPLAGKYENDIPFDNNGYADIPGNGAQGSVQKSIIYNYTQNAMVATAMVTLPTELKGNQLTWDISAGNKHPISDISSLKVYDSSAAKLGPASGNWKAVDNSGRIEVTHPLTAADAGKSYSIAFVIRTDTGLGSEDSFDLSSNVSIKDGNNLITQSNYAAHLFYNNAGQTVFSPVLQVQDLNMTPDEATNYPFPIANHNPMLWYNYSFATLFWDNNKGSKPAVSYQGNFVATDPKTGKIIGTIDVTKSKQSPTVQPGEYHNVIVVKDESQEGMPITSAPVVLNVLGSITVAYVDVDTNQVVKQSVKRPQPNVVSKANTQQADITKKATAPGEAINLDYKNQLPDNYELASSLPNGQSQPKESQKWEDANQTFKVYVKKRVRHQPLRQIQIRHQPQRRVQHQPQRQHLPQHQPHHQTPTVMVTSRLPRLVKPFTH